jgi:hypothetical protein
MIFLQAVDLPERCFLQEVLFWAAFQRLPIVMYDDRGTEIRDSDEFEDYEVDSYGGDFIDEDECTRAGLPIDPRYTAIMEDGVTPSVEHCDRLLSIVKLEDSDRADLESQRRQALAFEQSLTEWQEKYNSVIEYHTSRIFVALREGRLEAVGKLLPHLDTVEALDALEADGKSISDLETVQIPRGFWSLSGTDWSSSAARNEHRHYCWIRCRTEQVLTVFPIEDRRPVEGIEQVGSFYILDDAVAVESQRVTKAKARGRPPYPWEGFHLEVADLLSRGELPEKKEAAIQHFQDWFERRLGQRPSRAAIGEKLKPYYDRFMRASDRK